MLIFRNLASIPRGAIRDAYITIGNFDGVHRGHRALLGQVCESARAAGGTSVAVTFWPHPRAVVSSKPPKLVCSLAQREAWIAETDVNVLVVQDFDRAFSQTPPENFLRDIVAKLGAKHLILGHDFRFGKGGTGSADLAKQMSGELNISVDEFGQVFLHESVVSSSHIRDALELGDVRKAHEFLGRPWQIWGSSTSGAGRGKTLGFPTINFATENDLLVPDGVYGGRIHLANNQTFVAAVSVGTNPTFGAEPRHVEAFILDCNEPAVVGQLKLEFLAYIRNQVTFVHAGKLIEQIEADVQIVRDHAEREHWLATAPL